MLRFSPTAWAKLQFFCHRGETEIGGFGISSPEDPLLIEEFATIEQRVTAVSVAFDDDAVADFFESQVDAGRKPEQFARLWMHTHPCDSPMPSMVDEETFGRVFGRCDWAVMFILAREGKTYARLRWNVGPGGQILIPVQIDFKRPFDGSDHEAWTLEYERNIHVSEVNVWGSRDGQGSHEGIQEDFWDDREFLDLDDQASEPTGLEPWDDFADFYTDESEDA